MNHKNSFNADESASHNADNLLAIRVHGGLLEQVLDEAIILGNGRHATDDPAITEEALRDVSGIDITKEFEARLIVQALAAPDALEACSKTLA